MRGWKEKWSHYQNIMATVRIWAIWFFILIHWHRLFWVFFFFLIPADFYFSAGIWYISHYDWYNQVRILAAAFFINFSPIMWPVESAYGSSGFSGWNPVRPVLSELMYTRFSILKNRISVRFDIFPIGPPIRSEFWNLAWIRVEVNILTCPTYQVLDEFFPPQRNKRVRTSFAHLAY